MRLGCAKIRPKIRAKLTVCAKHSLCQTMENPWAPVVVAVENAMAACDPRGVLDSNAPYCAQALQQIIKEMDGDEDKEKLALFFTGVIQYIVEEYEKPIKECKEALEYSYRKQVEAEDELARAAETVAHLEKQLAAERTVITAVKRIMQRIG